MLSLPFSETYIAFTGLLCLGLAFHSRSEKMRHFAAPGWVLFGFYFFLGTPYYVGLADPVLILMSAATLPVGFALAAWELKLLKENNTSESLMWFQGAVLWSGLPYLLVDKVPWLNVLAIWFVASQSILFMKMTGAGDIQMGETYVHIQGEQPVTWAEWGGNRWFLDSGGTEHTFQTELLSASGEPIFISFVLACTALQSMIIFVGAIAALKTAPWKRRVRALLVTLPLIHILNIFRNAGLIWLHTSFDGWSWLTLSMFDFGHSYAAKAGSLAAMFLMALVLFELLPQLHQHIIELLNKLNPKGNRTKHQA